MILLFVNKREIAMKRARDRFQIKTDNRECESYIMIQQTINHGLVITTFFVSLLKISYIVVSL